MIVVISLLMCIMCIIILMKYNELKKILIENGWTFLRQGKGSHTIWRKGIETLIVPNHGSKELSNYFSKLGKKMKEGKNEF